MALSRDEVEQFLAKELNLLNPREGWERILVDPFSKEVRVLNLYDLDIKELDLTFLERFPGIERLDLDRNLLKRLDLTPLQHCKNLKVLQLGCNDFYGFSLDLTPLEQCPLLERINLAGDMTLASAEPNISIVKLPKAPRLKILDMHMNSLTSVDLSPLAGCNLLEDLDLSWNHIERTNLDQLQGCHNLKHLKLYINVLQNFPPEACIPSLKTLTLGFNKLTQLPGEIGTLTELETLDVSYNPLCGFPSSIANLQNLRTLNLAKLTIEEAPRFGDHPLHLQTLNLHQTSQVLRKSILNPYPDLQSLFLSSNNLDSIPEQVQGYLRLKELNLAFNQISRLPSWFDNLTQLENLDLAGNPLMTIPEEIFSLQKLHTLSFRSVPLTALPKTLLDLPVLKTLFIPDKFLQDPLIKELTNRGVYVTCRGVFN